MQAICREIESIGHESITDWFSVPLLISGDDRGAQLDAVKRGVERHVAVVINCYIFILPADPVEFRGKYVELGTAIVSTLLTGKPKIYSLGEYKSHPAFFYHHCVNRMDSLEDRLID